MTNTADLMREYQAHAALAATARLTAAAPSYFDYQAARTVYAPSRARARRAARCYLAGMPALLAVQAE